MNCCVNNYTASVQLLCKECSGVGQAWSSPLEGQQRQSLTTSLRLGGVCVWRKLCSDWGSLGSGKKGFYPQASASLLFWVSKTLGVQANLDTHTLIKCTGDVRSLQEWIPAAAAAISAPCSVPAQLSLQKAYLGPTEHIFPETVIFLCSSKKRGTACWQAGSERSNICRNPRFNSRTDLYF